jgi:hypothetical protein
MKPTQAKIANLWCRLMHAEPMWPSHGQYECRTCGRRHRVCWEQPGRWTSECFSSIVCDQPAEVCRHGARQSQEPAAQFLDQRRRSR